MPKPPPKKEIPVPIANPTDADLEVEGEFVEFLEDRKELVQLMIDDGMEASEVLVEIKKMKQEMKTEGRKLFERCSALEPDRRDEFKQMVADFQWAMKNFAEMLAE